MDFLRKAQGTGKLKGLVKKYWGRVGRSRERAGHQFLSPWSGVGRSIFSYPWGWVILFFFVFFLTGIGTHLTQSTTKVTPSCSKGRNLFEPLLKKYPCLVNNRDDNFVYCKICTKAKKSNGLSKESQGRNFQILCSALKNTKWPTCVYTLLVPKGAGRDTCS